MTQTKSRRSQGVGSRKDSATPVRKNAICRKPGEYFLELARAFYEKHDRPPKTRDFTQQVRYTINERFGSWEEYILKALRVQHTHRVLSEVRLLDFLRSWFEESHRFLTWDEIRSLDPSVASVLHKRFKSLSVAYEQAVGNSPRLVILRAIERLTPPGCDVASVSEIHDVLKRSGTDLGRAKVAHVLEYMSRDQLVTRTKGDKVSNWKMTPSGRELLRRPGGKE